MSARRTTPPPLPQSRRTERCPACGLQLARWPIRQSQGFIFPLPGLLGDDGERRQITSTWRCKGCGHTWQTVEVVTPPRPTVPVSAADLSGK